MTDDWQRDDLTRDPHGLSSEYEQGLMEPLSAAVLAGGRSRRMGIDKALLALAPGGPTMLDLAVTTARQVADDVFVVAPARRGYEHLNVPLVSERRPAVGPLGGIEAALQTARHDRCLILACDLPLVRRTLLRWLAGLPCEKDALVPMTPDPCRLDQHRLQPLIAIYRRRCLPVVSELIGRGVRRLADLIERLEVCYVTPEQMVKVDSGFMSFLNVNTPADLVRVRELIDAGRQSD